MSAITSRKSGLKWKGPFKQPAFSGAHAKVVTQKYWEAPPFTVTTIDGQHFHAHKQIDGSLQPFSLAHGSLESAQLACEKDSERTKVGASR